MPNILNGFFEFIAALLIALVVIILILIGVIFSGKGEDEYREIELIIMEEVPAFYDFCEVKETIYKFKEQEQ